MHGLTKGRHQRFTSVVEHRQYDLTVLLENVHDPHNIGAVMRSCDAVGIPEVYVLYTEPELQAKGVRPGHKSSSGASKWIEINYFTCLDSCISSLRDRYNQLVGAHIHPESTSLYDLDLTKSTALVFGNEHSGLSDAIMENLDGFFAIPQFGFVESLNISVACALTVFESMRQRIDQGNYQRNFGEHPSDVRWYEYYCAVQDKKRRRGRVK